MMTIPSSVQAELGQPGAEFRHITGVKLALAQLAAGSHHLVAGGDNRHFGRNINLGRGQAGGRQKTDLGRVQLDTPDGDSIFDADIPALLLDVAPGIGGIKRLNYI